MTKKLVTAMVILTAAASSLAAVTEMERKAIVEQWDSKNLIESFGMVTDMSKEFLVIPEDYPGDRNLFTLAKTPPTIDFAPVRGLIPAYFPETNRGFWTQWGEVTKAPNGCFYMASGDHRCQDGHVYITEYDPAKREQRIVVNVGAVCGWRKGQYVDGKIHGRMDVFPDGTLVAATWLGRDVKQDDLDHGYVPGGHLMTYNTNTGMTKYLGVPFYGDSWPYYSVDTRTGVMLAVGNDGLFMAYDVLKQKLLYGGMPTGGIRWNTRAMLLDESTGMVYGTNTEKYHNFTADNAEYRFVSYDQRSNTFRMLPCAVPTNPVTRKTSNLRAYTERKTPGGFFWCFDYQGTLFKFFPDDERTEIVGVNWDREGVYTASIAMSPQCRYLYYLIGANTGSSSWGNPVVQYDTVKGTKKVITFLTPFYHTKYGYLTGGTFGIELSADGSLLVIQTNGVFGPKGSGGMGQPGIFAIHIPESEREE